MTYSELEHQFCLEAKAAGHEVAVMTMCPFCGGPPSLIYRPYRTEGVEADFFNAYVFCHDCGATSAEVDELIEIPARSEWQDDDEWEAEQKEHKRMLAGLIRAAVDKWNTRDSRGASCYSPALETVYINDDAQEVRFYDWLRERGYAPDVVAKA